MSKKMMLLAAGVLAALAFTALPSVASAGSFKGTCSSGATCTGTIESTGIATLEDDGGGAVECSSVTGTTVQTHNSPTGTAQLTFHGCKDELFGTACTSTGQLSGTIKTNTLTSKLVFAEPNLGTPAVLLSGVNVTFTCGGGLVRKTVTGNVIGEIETPECGVARANHTIVFAKKLPTGTQQWEQITTTGTFYDLIVASQNHTEPAYTTAAQTGTAHINYTEGKKVTLDCKESVVH